MRYKLDLDGYIMSVAFGCYLNNCTEYTGTVPIGYNSLDSWATYAFVNAYYIDSNGNLAYDAEREMLLKEKEAQDATDNTPLIRKDLYESEAVLDSQYIKETKTGEVIVLENIRTVPPLVRITDIDASRYKNLAVYTHGKNMMPCNARDETINGVTFSRGYSGAITVSGLATADVEYTVAGNASNTVPLFALRKDQDYYLNLGGFRCELRYYDGETTKQQYVGPSGLLNVSESMEVTQVLIKIPFGEPLYPADTLYPGETLFPSNYGEVNTTFMPQLEYGSSYTSYEAYKRKSLSMDFSEFVDDGDTVDYIQIEKGVIYISIGGMVQVLGSGNVGLYSAYNTIYATKDSTLEVTYSTTVYDVESMEFLQGKATTTNQFKILKDGSIEAHNGYFSGKIEADSGYFKGKIESESATINGGSINIGSAFYVDKTGYLRASNGVFGPWHITPTTFITEDYNFQITKQPDGSWTLGSNGSGRFDKSLSTSGQLSAGSLMVTGDFYASGEKSRLANTENYGSRLLYCYEMPSPMFGDIGEGQLDETGKCYVFFDDVFSETIDTDCAYQVFLQPYGDGTCYVAERTSAYFVVCGTASMRFGWELKAIQKDYDTIRLEEPTQEEMDATAEALLETGNYLNSLLYNVESEVF